MEHPTEEAVATLIQPYEYSHHLNQVSGLTAKSILVLKRKFVSRQGSEIARYPLEDCTRVEYEDERRLYIIFAGLFLLALMFSIFFAIYLYRNDLSSNIKTYASSFGLALLYGFRWLFKARRHRLTFVMRDGTRYFWKSSSGDFKTKSLAVTRIIDTTRSLGLYSDMK